MKLSKNQQRSGEILERPVSFRQVFDQSEVGQNTIVINWFSVNYHQSRTVTNSSILWNTLKQGVIFTSLLISCLGYYWIFDRMSPLLLSNLYLGLFAGSVLPMTKVRDNFRETSLTLLIFDQGEGGRITSLIFWFTIIYHYIITLTIQFSLWNIRK